MTEANKIPVEVAYALPDKQVILAVEVPAGATALEAARLSGIADKFEEIDLENAKLGVYHPTVV